MKGLKIALALILMIILQAGCGTVTNTSRSNVPGDMRRIFVGAWEGEYADHEGKLVRTWIQNRFEDGTYKILFIHHSEKGVYKSTQQGKWWIDGDRFFEIAPDVMKEPDVYTFEMLSNDEIHFKRIGRDYEFTDRRIHGFHDVTLI